MLYSEVINRLEEMRGRFDDGFSSSDRLFLQEMSVKVLGRPVRNTSCKDCYRDAYLEIRYKLKKQGTMPKEKTFILRAGVLLHYAGEAYVNENLTDDIAMDAINDNRGRLDLFQKVPDNIEEVLAARKAVKAQEKSDIDGTSKEELLKQVAGLKAVNAEQKEKLEGAEKTFEQKEAEIESLRGELATAKEDVEKAKVDAQAEAERLNDVITEKDAKIEELEKALAAASAAAPAPAASAGEAAGEGAGDTAGAQTAEPAKKTAAAKK